MRRCARVVIEVEFCRFYREFDFSGFDLCDNFIRGVDVIVRCEPLRLAIFIGDDDFFAEHVDIGDAADSPLREDTPAFFGQRAPFFHVVTIFVTHAAIEPSAYAADALWVRREALGAELLDRDGVELPEESPAAQQLSACAETADQAGAVPEAELIHLDTKLELSGKISDHIPEVHAHIRGKVDRDVLVVMAEIGREYLHLQVLRDGVA